MTTLFRQQPGNSRTKAAGCPLMIDVRRSVRGKPLRPA